MLRRAHESPSDSQMTREITNKPASIRHRTRYRRRSASCDFPMSSYDGRVEYQSQIQHSRRKGGFIKFNCPGRVEEAEKVRKRASSIQMVTHQTKGGKVSSLCAVLTSSKQRSVIFHSVLDKHRAVVALLTIDIGRMDNSQNF